mmetsp:Transcript_23033/g.26283  ORF Transcript_23033/g.26283 Transcript_23033/m.26283 type:complete len:381 (+) Transcript_23033:596-1738(+)
MSKRGLSLISSLISPDLGRKKQALSRDYDKENEKESDSDAIVLDQTKASKEIMKRPSTTAANKFVNRVVKLLGDNKDDKNEDDPINLHVLEVLSQMDFYKNMRMREALKLTDICENLCQMLQSLPSSSLTVGKKEDVSFKIVTLIVDLTHMDTKGSFRERFASFDCLSLLIQQMKSYPDNEKLQETACRAIDNICAYMRYNYSDTSSKTKKLFHDGIHNSDNLQTFYDTMKKYTGNRCIHMRIIACLYVYLILHTNNENESFIKDLLITMGFTELIYNALETNANYENDKDDDDDSSSTSLMKMCLLILKVMAQYEKQTRIFLREKDGIFTLATLINTFHPSNPTNTNSEKEEAIHILNLSMELLQTVYDNTETNSITAE